MLTPLLQCDHVSLFLPGDARHELVLHDISWTVEEGCHAALLGSNGSGKSTVLRLFAGLLWPASGTISWRDTDGTLDTSPLTGRALTALVSPAEQVRYQKHAWSITGLELVLTGFEGTTFLSSENKSRQEAIGRVRELARTLRCEDLLYRDSSLLSQGQLRILLLCRALIKKPKLLLLDECTDGLDATHLRAILGLLDEIAERTTMIFVTHDVGLIPSFCKEVRRMHEGRLGDASVLVRESQSETRAVPRIAYEASENPPVFSIKNASVYLDRVCVLHEISCTIRRGEHWLLSGANGSGKSTFLRLLIGDVFCAAGGSIERYLPNRAGTLERVECLEQIRAGISLVSPQYEANYDYPVTALELVCSGFENSVGLYRSFTEEEKLFAEGLMHRFFPELSDAQCDALCRTPFNFLSTGQVRRLFLARALVCQPAVLLLDEPLSGLDTASAAQFSACIDTMAKSLTIVLVSHVQDHLPTCIHRFGMFEDGRFYEQRV